MPRYAAPGVRFETVDASSGTIAALRTDVAAFVGVCERGPLATPVRVGSWEQFRAAFGNLAPYAFLPWSVKAFFENGGRTCWVTRVAARAASTRSAGAQSDRAKTTVLDATGFTAGAVATLTQSTTATLIATAADRLSSQFSAPPNTGFASGATATLSQTAQTTLRQVQRIATIDGTTIYWAAPLDERFDLTQPIALDTTARGERLIAEVTGNTITWTRAIPTEYDLSRAIDIATGASAASGILLDATGVPTWLVEASSPGAWGNGVRVFVSRASRHATRSAGTQSSAAYSVVESVTGITAGMVMKIFQDGIPPIHRVVAAVDPARKRIDWQLPLATLDLTMPFSIESDEVVIDAPPQSIRITELATTAPPPLSFPVPAELRLAGGRDGTAALRADDLIDGLRTLETVDEVSFIAIPDVLIERVPALEVIAEPPPQPDPCAIPPLPPTVVADPAPPVIREQSAAFDLTDVLRVQNAMIDHCETLRDRMALLDPPNFRPSERGEIDSWRRRFDTKYAALYYPWITVLDAQSPRELTRAIPPSGHVAGIWARTDLATGVHKAPANEELRWAQDATLDVSDALHELLNPAGINAIRSLPPRGLKVYGARTVSSDPLWRYVNVRRLLIMIEEALEEALQWSVFEPHDAALREKVAMSIYSFLERLWEQGALAGATAGEAFYIRCNESNNPPDAVANGHLVAEVGVAPVIPAEFVIFRIGRTEDVLETREEGEE